MLTSNEIRKRFLDFFEKRGHTVLASASLVTTDEKGQTNATLFNTAGMQPLIPFLLGETHEGGTRLASSQKCVRTNDIEEVGDNTHLTFFEMLGNWSLGDYFKEDAIKWSFEFLTSKDQGLGLDIDRLYVTVFSGNDDVERDEEAANIWRAIFTEKGLDPEKRIFYLSSKSNWWTAGPDSPAGPSTEMFYDVTGVLTEGLTHEEFLKADEEQKVVEIWNDVFMAFKQEAGKVVGPLPKRNVDTGAGLERVAMVVQGKNNVFETDLFSGILAYIKSVSSSYQERSARIIADHTKAGMMLIADGVIPSNKDRGYILRRIIRRAMVEAKNIGLSSELLLSVFTLCQDLYSEVYSTKKGGSLEVFSDELSKFEKTLDQGLKEFEKGERDAFVLFTTYGFPFEMVKELALARGEEIDQEDFLTKMKDHQDKSRLGAEQKFKGGLAGHSDMEVKYHTATHLLHQALRDVLGNHVFQKGSNITPERLRFDFSHNEKMTPEEIKRVEQIVNEKIADSLPISFQEVPLDDARNKGALGLFGDKYGETVTLYQIGNGDERYSLEICGGPHVENTGTLGVFKIQKEEASSAGVRRIKAVLE
jgi:alanyl-tRNA synthetase